MRTDIGRSDKVWEWWYLGVSVSVCAILTTLDRGWGSRSWGVAMGLLWPIAISIGIGRAEFVGTDPTDLAAGGAIMVTSLVLFTGFRPAALAWKLMEPEVLDEPGFRYRVWGGWGRPGDRNSRWGAVHHL